MIAWKPLMLYEACDPLTKRVLSRPVNTEMALIPPVFADSESGAMRQAPVSVWG